MTGVCHAIFKAIHEGKWLSVEYKNQTGQTTKYWLAIKTLNPRTGQMKVDGLHLGQYTVQELLVRIEGIQTAEVIDGSWCAVNEALVQDILENPHRYEAWFGDTANLRVLEYLALCSKLDNTPYKTDYALIRYLDADRLAAGEMALTDAQFAAIVRQFQHRSEHSKEGQTLQLRQLALNLLSVDTPRGLYVLAYRPLLLDVANRRLRVADDPVICREFTIDGVKVSAHNFLDAEDYVLLDNFLKNAETIKDCITRNLNLSRRGGVNDLPYLLAIGRDCLVDLEQQYKGITTMFETPDGEGVTPPIRAFFGQMTARPRRRKSFPLALLNNRANLDQLLAINNAMRYPLAYVQGPPGTGKTSTIVNTMTTAFFNERTVLFASYNNHPIDGVVEKLRSLTYRGQPIPFPIVRLGSRPRVKTALAEMRRMYEACKPLTIFEKTLDRNHAQRAERAKRLTELLERYEEILDLQERRDTIRRLLEARHHLNFQYELQSGQLPKVEAELKARGTVTSEDALALLDQNTEDFLKYLYYTSARFIRRLGEPKNKDLLDILYANTDEDDRVTAFNKYLSQTENLKKFLRIFPFVATTCISAQRLGDPEPVFDMVIMDEASQCNTAVSLVPILRGESLMLVGDPQQLQPVILLDPHDNAILRRRYHVSEEYDYLENSIYKCFLACDAVSDEVLLRYHYRCDPKIIGFNNKKYYNNKLEIASQGQSDRPLVYLNVPEDTTHDKNTAPAEVAAIDRYLSEHPDASVGIITPFAKQRTQIEEMLQQRHYENASCGTVHAFQGDEKDIVLFSLALTDKTGPKTYQWLKNNKELINVATSRARDQLILLSNAGELERLHTGQGDDDLYDLYRYVRTSGVSEVVPKPAASRALGIKPYSTRTEDAFLESLNHALDNVFVAGSRCVVRREVAIAHVFQNNPGAVDLFYTGRFDFVVYQREGRQLTPLLAIELDGREHRDDPVVQARDRKKERICQEHDFELIRVDNTYARRYHYIKEILIQYFNRR